MTDIHIDVAELMGNGYDDFWCFEGRYRVVKGGRGSKKSTTTALWIVISMMMVPQSNTLVLRRYFNTHRNSTFAQIQWAITRRGVGTLWKATMSPLEMTFKPTGQKILFRGLDDPQSITSIPLFARMYAIVPPPPSSTLPSSPICQKTFSSSSSFLIL